MEALLLAGGHVYTNGLPIVCERHPGVHSDISAPSQFGGYAPNGGCTQVSATTELNYYCCYYDTSTATETAA
jgi:hypothetical protein